MKMHSDIRTASKERKEKQGRKIADRACGDQISNHTVR